MKLESRLDLCFQLIHAINYKTLYKVLSRPYICVVGFLKLFPIVETGFKTSTIATQ